MSINKSKEVVEFQPDALEIKQERLPWWARYSVLLIALFFAIAITWSIISKVDVIVSGRGKLVTDKNNIVMKPKETTVIKSVDVRVGELVKKNQRLFSFDTEINKAETDRLDSELSTLTEQFRRLHAEFDKKEYVPENKNSRDAIWQKAIFDQRKQFYTEKIAYYNEGIKQLEASVNTTKETLGKQDERLGAVQKIEKMYSELLNKKAVSLRELLEMQITRMQMEAEVDKLRNSLIEQEHQKLSTVASKNAFIEEWRNSISTELVKIERELVSTQKQHAKMEQLNSYVILRAPSEAIVHEIASYAPGSAVQEAEALITLVPLDGQIELEVDLDPKDIGKVAVGSEVRVKLDAFPFQRYGTLSGRVRSISEDTFERRQGEVGETPTYYRARVTVSGKLININRDFRLIPGMEVQAEIKTGRRRVIEYILYPLIKALDEAAREP